MLRIGVGTVVGLILLALPFWVSSTWQNLLITVFYYAFLGQAWNILGGYAGQLSLGHAAFFAIGAYTSAVLAVHYAVSPWLGMFVGAVLAALLSLGIGYLGFRFGLRGFYFILLTLAAAEICRLVALHLPILGGYTGLFINFTPNPWQFQFKGKIPYYFIALGFLVFASAVVWLLERSKLGTYLVAIREDEDASEALGVDTFRYKMMAYALSAALTALGGTFYAYFQYYLQPNTVLNLNHSVDIMIRPIVGGMGTILGPILGSLLLELLGEFSRTYFAGATAGLSIVTYGILLIIVVLFLPRGIYPRWPTGFGELGGAHEPPSRQRGEQGLRGAAGGPPGELRPSRGGDPGAHRAQRRREDYAVQCGVWLHAAGRGNGHLPGGIPGGAPPPRHLPARDGPDVSDRPPVPAPDATGERGGGRAGTRRASPGGA